MLRAALEEDEKIAEAQAQLEAKYVALQVLSTNNVSEINIDAVPPNGSEDGSAKKVARYLMDSDFTLAGVQQQDDLVIPPAVPRNPPQLPKPRVDPPRHTAPDTKASGSPNYFVITSEFNS